MVPNSYSARDLLERCQEARNSGVQFPTIWESILRGHPMVLGIPVQVMLGKSPCLKVPLLGGNHLCVCSDEVQIVD